MEASVNKLGIKKLFLMGGALFAMHFGGSSMIWPMTWGQQSGSSVLPAFAGIYLTAVFFPLLGYIALSRGKDSFYGISKRISKPFADIFCSITILVLGPLFVIPRMSAAAWDAFLQISGFTPTNFVPAFIFAVLYYIITYWFIAKKSETVDKLSKILFPILIISICAIFVKGLLFPLSQWAPKTYSQPAFAYGFVNGYATMELPCALVFAAIIINDLKGKGFSGKSLDYNLLRVGFIGTGILTITHFCHMLVGSFTGDLFMNLNYSALYARVVVALWGNFGGAVFNIALLFAALTTAIGLTAATCEYFEETSKGKYSYKQIAVFTLVISTLISVIGLSKIVSLTAPLLDIIYPAAITMTLCYALIPDIIHKDRLMSSMRWAVYAAFLWGIFEGILGYSKLLNINHDLLVKVHHAFPLSTIGMGWIGITAFVFILRYLMVQDKNCSNTKHTIG